MTCTAQISPQALAAAGKKLRPASSRDQHVKYSKASEFNVIHGKPTEYMNRMNQRAKHNGKLAKSHEAYTRRVSRQQENMGKTVQAHYNGDTGVITQQAKSRLSRLSKNKVKSESWWGQERPLWVKRKDITTERVEVKNKKKSEGKIPGINGTELFFGFE